MLHDRRMPRTRANIDHLAIAASGVYVIDTKRYRGKVEVRKPLFGEPTLRIAGRDKTKLVAGLAKQLEGVRAVVAELVPDLPVHGCFCFVAPEGLLADSGIPLLRTLTVNGYSLYYPRTLAKQLNRPGPITTENSTALATWLGNRFPPA